MHPQRRTALVSVAAAPAARAPPAVARRAGGRRPPARGSGRAAAALVVLKLVTGLASGSLGLVSEALHSGTDLVAALLTFFAVGLSGRPADESHQYGHGKAEHLAALFEASVLALVSVGVAALAGAPLAGWVDHRLPA